WFFSQWVIDGAGHPELDIQIRWDHDTQLATVAVEQTQKVEGRTPVFRLPTKIRFRVNDRDVDMPLEIVEAKHVFHLHLDAEPTHVLPRPLDAEPHKATFHPGPTLLPPRNIDNPEPLWIAELASATLAIDRGAAAVALAKRGGPAAEQALLSAVETDRFWAV